MRKILVSFFFISGIVFAQAVPPRNRISGGVSQDQWQTVAPLNLYVSTTGNDANSCISPSFPCLTIQASCNKIPFNVKHKVKISVASGSYAKGCYLPGFRFFPGGSIEISGTIVAFTPATGVTSGSVTTATNGTGAIRGVISSAGAGWTSGNLIGRLLCFTGGPASGQCHIIGANTASTITISGIFSSCLIPGGGTCVTPTAASTFQLRTPGSTIQGGVDLPASATSAAITNHAGFILSGHADSSSASGTILISGFDFTDSTGSSGARISSTIGSTFAFNRFDNLINPAFLIDGNGTYTFRDNNYSISLVSLNSHVIDILPGANPSSIFNFSSFVASARSFMNAMSPIAYYFEQYSLISSISGKTHQFGFVGDGTINYPIVTVTGNDCIYLSNSVGTQSSGQMVINGASLSGCQNAILATDGISTIIDNNIGDATVGSGNTVSISVSRGAKVKISSTTSIAATTDTLVDGLPFSFATIRAASPKSITSKSSGASVYQDLVSPARVLGGVDTSQKFIASSTALDAITSNGGIVYKDVSGLTGTTCTPSLKGTSVAVPVGSLEGLHICNGSRWEYLTKGEVLLAYTGRKANSQFGPDSGVLLGAVPPITTNGTIQALLLTGQEDGQCAGACVPGVTTATIQVMQGATVLCSATILCTGAAGTVLPIAPCAANEFTEYSIGGPLTFSYASPQTCTNNPIVQISVLYILYRPTLP